MATSSEHVVLRSGLLASLAALRLGWDLEERGFRLEPVGDKLRVAPRAALTAADVAAIKAHRNELLLLVRYQCPDVVH